MIVPELAGADVDELNDLRAACAAAVDRLLAAEPEVVLVVGAGERTARHGPADHGTLRGYGLDRHVHLSRVNCAGQAGLPLSLMIGSWLLHRAGARCLRVGQSIAPDTPPAECRRLGGELVKETDSALALLVMGDGSARRGVRSPGYDDPRARPYDEGVAAALAGADSAALLDLDPDLSARLWVGGRAPWQALAGAVAGTGARWRGELTYAAAPYGVGYFVANWTPA